MGFFLKQNLVIFMLVWLVKTSKKPKKQIEIVSKNRDLCRKEKYDNIQLMDVPKKVQMELVSLLKFKSKSELETISGWIDRRIGMMEQQ